MVATPQIGRKLARKRAHKPAEPAPIKEQPLTGAQIVAYWDREGLGGVYSDPARFPQDSPELARILRRQAEMRE